MNHNACGKYKNYITFCWLEDCLRWIKACGGPHEQLNVTKIKDHYNVCSKHFVDGKPSATHPDPIPADGRIVQRTRKSRKRVQADDMFNDNAQNESDGVGEFQEDHGRKKHKTISESQNNEDLIDDKARKDEVLHRHNKGKRSRRPKVKCAHCGYGTRNTEHMSDHVINFHLRVDGHECCRCGFTVMSKKMLFEHKREDHPTKRSLREKCQLCSYACGTPGLLHRHQLFCHSKDCPWTCSFCAFVSRTEVVLARHVDRAHRFDNCCVCGICGCRGLSLPPGSELRPNKELMKVHIIKKHLQSLHRTKKAPSDKGTATK